MKLNKKQVASLINQLATVKARLSPLLAKEEVLSAAIKKAGGGESGTWVATLVDQPRKVVVMKAHKRLQLTKKKKKK